MWLRLQRMFPWCDCSIAHIQARHHQITAIATNVTEKGIAAISLAIQVAASAAQQLAITNAAAQLAATVKCCCDLEGVMRALEASRLQAELTEAKLTIALNNRRAVIPGI